MENVAQWQHDLKVLNNREVEINNYSIQFNGKWGNFPSTEGG